MDASLGLHESGLKYRVPSRLALIGSRPCLIDLLRLLGTDSDVPGAAADLPLVLRQLHAGDALFHEGAHADAVYFVRAGTFKTFCTAEDGYEQVLGFCGRTEVLGFDAICMGSHPTAAVALEDSSVYVLPVRDVFELGRRVPGLDRAIATAVSRALTYRAELAEVMAAVAAEVRLARFLVRLSQRMQACGQSPRRLRLRMSRRDIASHLGVAHETVSRAFHALSDAALVQVSNREVEIVDMHELKVFARATRRPTDDAEHLDHAVHAGGCEGAVRNALDGRDRTPGPALRPRARVAAELTA